jgi:hypothetical protein
MPIQLDKVESVDAIKVTGGTECSASNTDSTLRIVKERQPINDRTRKQSLNCLRVRESIGGGERDRTDDPLLAKQVLSQLSYTPTVLGGSGWIRTNDPRLIKTVL